MEATHLFLLQLKHLLMLPLDHLGFLLLQVFRGRGGGMGSQVRSHSQCVCTWYEHAVWWWGAADNDSSLWQAGNSSHRAVQAVICGDLNELLSLFELGQSEFLSGRVDVLEENIQTHIVKVQSTQVQTTPSHPRPHTHTGAVTLNPAPWTLKTPSPSHIHTGAVTLNPAPWTLKTPSPSHIHTGAVTLNPAPWTLKTPSPSHIHTGAVTVYPAPWTLKTPSLSHIHTGVFLNNQHNSTTRKCAHKGPLVSACPHSDDDSNEEVGEDEVAEEDEHNGKELAAHVALGGQAVLEVCPAVSLRGWVVGLCVCV